MRLVRLAILVVMLAAALAGTAATSALAKDAKGKVTAERSGTFSLTFHAGGTLTDAKGRVTYHEDLTGYSFSGNVTCYYQEGKMAIMTGRVTEEKPFSTGTTGFVLWVMDGPSPIYGRPEGFDIAGGAFPMPDCTPSNFPFPFDQVDPFGFFRDYYVVTDGDIVVK